MQIGSYSDIPQCPAIYALFGGRGTHAYVAYVGQASNLKKRIRQHFVLRDSSAVTDAGAVRLHPDYVTELHWWTIEGASDPTTLDAAEQVAFLVLNPALRSRGRPTQAAIAQANDADFEARMTSLFGTTPSGVILLPTLANLQNRVVELEAAVATLQER